jgi:asparagine synthase (glutamine-hydrolysing)
MSHGYATDMCGIVGKVCLDGHVDRLLINAMCDVIEHRGPDSRGVFVDRQVGLGVQRLAIIDLETGDQPIYNEDQSIVIVFNGEIYNYRELRDLLTDGGHRLNSDSDTEVLVHLYEDHGDDFVRMLRGMFAFALWDVRRERLLLGRDRIGKKPLYFSFNGSCLWFASEAKAILQDPAVPRDVDYAAIDAFLHYQYVPNTYCSFAALSKLPPAHTLAFEYGRVEQRRYWDLSYGDQINPSNEEACDLIRTHLLDATRLRLRSDVPLGAFLSGGVDSSAVVAAMAQQVSGQVKTFTIGFPAERFDERPYAREVARLFDTDHYELLVEPEVLHILPQLVWHYGEPFADQSAIPSFYLAEMTRRDVTVALNGDGGDENFAGYRRYIGNDVAKRLEVLPVIAGRVAAELLKRVGTGNTQDSTRARLLRLSRGLQLDAPGRYAMWIACLQESERQALYEPDFARQLEESRPESLVRWAYETSDAPTTIERLLDVDIQTYLPDQLLVKMDIASMAYSLEVRSPFLDHKFMEMAASLPLSAKVHDGSGKHLLKEALRPWLPGDILDRPKRGFTMPISDWLRNELRDLPGAILLDTRSIQRGLFRREIIQRMIAQHQAGRSDNSNKLWALIQLELWFRTYVDVEPRGPITFDFNEFLSHRPRRSSIGTGV